MSGPIEIVAIITPLPGKIDEVIEGLSVLNKHVEANEPGALRYQMYKQINAADGVECLVYIEVFKDMAAVQAHRTSEVYAAIQKQGAETQLLAAAPDIKVLQHVGGFGLREA